MSVKVIDILSDKEIASLPVNALFKCDKIRFDIIKRVILWQLNKRRSGNHKVKTISEISGTTAKPYRQKGTGRARQGSRRSPQFRGGATLFGPVVRSHATKLPKKVRKLGLVHSLSHHFKNDSVACLAEPKLEKISTKKIAGFFNNKAQRTLLIYGEETDKNFLLSLNNIKNLDALHERGLNVYDIVNHHKIYFTEKAYQKMEERLVKC